MAEIRSDVRDDELMEVDLVEGIGWRAVAVEGEMEM